MCGRQPDTKATLAAALTRALFCGMRPGENRLAVFVSHSDETEAMSGRKRFLVGGYVAPETDWPYFAGEWDERVLAGPPRIPYLHMREITSPAWRSDHGISREQAEARVDVGVDVIGSAGSLSVLTSSLSRTDLKETLHAA